MWQVGPVLKIILLGVTRLYDQNHHMAVQNWEEMKNTFQQFISCLNSACICHLIGVLLQRTMHQYSQNFGNIKSFSDIEISACFRFLHCVGICDELAYLWGRLCMVTLYYRMTFKPHTDMIICRLRNIC